MALKQAQAQTDFKTPDFEEGNFEEGGYEAGHDEVSAPVASAAATQTVAPPAPTPASMAVQAQVTQVAQPVATIDLAKLEGKIALDAAKRIAPAGGFAAGVAKFGDRQSENVLGTWFSFIPISTWEQHFVTPNKGATLDEEERRLQIFGLDPVTSENGVNYENYVNELKAQGYKNASKERRLLLLCYVVDAEKCVGALETGGKQPVLFYLPLTSLNSFRTLVTRQEVEASIGMAEPITKLKAKAQSYKNKQNKSYSALTFEYEG